MSTKPPQRQSQRAPPGDARTASAFSEWHSVMAVIITACPTSTGANVYTDARSPQTALSYRRHQTVPSKSETS
ncbi:hypothetical protein B0H67DRAFT_117671 [Lasiosphaeris hirsuta]|uniref:Uncharacterized protein n=1 Tax=Lasiosphaeris hirsuta TaxID=260670 RepID=A0AA40AZI1_9PEZI|nr:hypothetical protein B0H67DRAFT_117671 [Lasiosphaeris hirsuta]